MTRVSTESRRTTLFQLEALVSALRLGSFSAAATELGIRDKHLLIKAVDRLADTLQIEGLTNRLGDEPVVPQGLRQLEESAGYVLGALSEFERNTKLVKTRTIVVRCSAYPSMVTIFLADAVARFERESEGSDERTEVRFVDLESTQRRRAGMSILRSLLTRLVDVAVGPSSTVPEKLDIESVPLYKWQLVAALAPEHELWTKVEESNGRPVVHLDEVAKFPLLLSPLGHKTRDLLSPFEPMDGFTIALESANTQARAALGRAGSRVPLIASDALTSTEFNPKWPAVGVKNEKSSEWLLFEDTHSVYWRTHISEAVDRQVESFVEVIKDAASIVRSRPGGGLPA